jgi:hypothetical protein
VYVPPLSILAEKRVILQTAQGAILHTDVLSFYHSIYTHAIPWALHGKAVTKSNRNPNDPAVFGNRIDSLVRSCQDGQTIGIPVGPDTSRILSELMLSAVEAHIPRKIFNRITAGFRYMDDFFLYFGTISDAETVLAGLREACLHFDLQLNAAKTITGSALAYNEDSWPSELSAIPIARSGKQQRRSLMRFFLAAIRLAKDLPDESIANFAVRRTSKIHVDKENWDLYQAFIIRMAIENSNCIDSVVKVLCTYAAVGYEVDSISMSRFVDKIIADHAPYNHHFEVAWTLWLARSLDIRLSPAASSFVMRIENDVCAILALHLRGRHLLSGGTRALSWISSVAAEDLYVDHWLLIYEAALHKGWPIAGASAAVSANKFFDSLKAEGISFYNTRAYNRPLNIPRIETELLSALSGRKRAILPGAILGVSGPREGRVFERLGGEYGEDDEDDPFSSYSTLDDNEDEGPF